MLKDVSASAAALYDGGWRSTDKEQLQQEYQLTDEETAALVDELEKMDQPEENRIEDVTPAEAWEGLVGEQSPEEFMAISNDKAQGTIEEAVRAYAQDINRMFDTDYTAEERDTIERKLAEYIEENTLKRVSLDNGNHYHTADTIPAEHLEGDAWDTLVFYMDDDAREYVVGQRDCPEDNREFLRRYLANAPTDLVIG